MIDVGADGEAARRTVAGQMGDDSDAERRRWFYTPGRRTRPRHGSCARFSTGVDSKD